MTSVMEFVSEATHLSEQWSKLNYLVFRLDVADFCYNKLVRIFFLKDISLSLKAFKEGGGITCSAGYLKLRSSNNFAY